MIRNNYFSQILLVILLIASLFLPTIASAIGQLTEPIAIENALRGQEFENAMSLFNTEDREVKAELISEGDIEGWATFYERENRSLPITEVKLDARARKGLIVVFAIPEDTPNGEYKGFISVKQAPLDTSTSSEAFATFQQKISREVTIAVTDQEEINFTADIIPDSYVIKLGESFKFKILYDNKGNVMIKPQVQVKIMQNEKTFYNAIIPYPDDLEGVKPLKSKEIPFIEVPVSGVELGKVRAEFTILYNEEVIKEDMLRFDVKEKSTENSAAGLKKFNFNVKWLYVVMGLVLIVMAAISYWIKIGKEKRKQLLHKLLLKRKDNKPEKKDKKKNGKNNKKKQSGNKKKANGKSNNK